MNNKLSSTPSPVDVYVGSRIRLRRTLLGMSQERLGTALGLTFQQVQKYERGANRVGASRLYDLARVLDVPIAFFFDGMPDEAAIAPVASMPAESFAEARGAFGGVPAPGQVEGGGRALRQQRTGITVPAGNHRPCAVLLPYQRSRRAQTRAGPCAFYGNGLRSIIHGAALDH